MDARRSGKTSLDAAVLEEASIRESWKTASSVKLPVDRDKRRRDNDT